jgi:hydrogenase expression/formation protein HypD
MKHLAEYRDAGLSMSLVQAIRTRASRRYTLMEICGGQTHSIVRNGFDSLLAPQITFVHGPGCPVCVTPASVIDHAVHIALQPGVIFCSFGDMIRVPGSDKSIALARAAGADIRILYTPLDAIPLARANPGRTVVFFGVGFETTAPVYATTVLAAERLGITNLKLLVSLVLVPPALDAILAGTSIDALLAAGHVCTVSGWEDYERFRMPVVVTGFEPADLLSGVLGAVEQLESGQCHVENRYARAVTREGNRVAREKVGRVFQCCDREWRGIGVIPRSGLQFRPEFRAFDAAHRFPFAGTDHASADPCIAGSILQGHAKPRDCPLFGTRCTPDHPIGAPMVSSEGACSAYYVYGMPSDLRA